VSKTPALSLIVTVVDGGEYLRSFLQACMVFDDPPEMEIIVPYDASIAGDLTYRDQFPDVNFLDIGTIVPDRAITSEAGQHELYDRRRAAGLAAAKGDVIGMLEDRGHPEADWAQTLMRLHRETGHNVIGGAIECKEPVSRMNWVFWVTDFGRYGRPFDSGAVDWVSDVNVSYSRKALEDTRHIWEERFHEPLVHSFLVDNGDALYLSNELVVQHSRPQVGLGHMLSERFQWGRLFGYIRAKQFSPKQRLIFIAASPLIPPVLWLRHGMLQRRQGRGMRYLVALPYVVLLTTAWTLGEFWGYITRRP